MQRWRMGVGGKNIESEGKLKIKKTVDNGGWGVF